MLLENPQLESALKKKLHQAELCQNCLLHNTFHFNFTDHFQNWSLQLTLKITLSFAKNKVAIVK